MSANYYAINEESRTAVLLGRSSWLDGISEVPATEQEAFVRQQNSTFQRPWPEENIQALLKALREVLPTVEAIEDYGGAEYWGNLDCVCVGGIDPDDYDIGRRLDGNLPTEGARYGD